VTLPYRVAHILQRSNGVQRERSGKILFRMYEQLHADSLFLNALLELINSLVLTKIKYSELIKLFIS
jgi:hypothetical protein